MKCTSADCQQYMQAVLPLLEKGDVQALAEMVSRRWTTTQLCRMLHEGSLDVRKVVCLTLGLVGDSRCTDCLSHALRDTDAQLSHMAEHALWSIWFRAGNDRAMPHFKRGLEAMNDNRMAQSLDHFHRAIQADPRFAEALNQCAIAHYLLEQYDQSLEDCLAAVELVPIHFGAMAGMGHCYAQKGDLEAAARCYRRALAIHPRMEGVIRALADIELRLGWPAPQPQVHRPAPG